MRLGKSKPGLKIVERKKIFRILILISLFSVFSGSGTACELYISDWDELKDIDGQNNDPICLDNDLTPSKDGYQDTFDMSTISPSNDLAGTFDGKGHKIKNLTIDGNGNDGAGMFGSLQSTGARVTNITFVNGKFEDGGDNTGFLAKDTGDSGVRVDHIYMDVKVDGEGPTGGIIGSHEAGTIENVVADAVITGSGNSGGIAGNIGGGEIKNSYSVSNVDLGEKDGQSGAIVGEKGGGTISSTYYNEEIEGDGIGGSETSSGVNSLTTAEMNGSSASSNMGDLDFSDGGEWLETVEGSKPVDSQDRVPASDGYPIINEVNITHQIGSQNIVLEDPLVERNIFQSISVGRKDTSRQISLGKSQITGLSFASTGLTDSFTNRLLTESLGFSSGKDRKQSLDKSVNPVLAFSRSGSNFKSTFPVFNSSILAGSTVSDIFSTGRMLDPVFGFSSSRSATAIFAGSVGETFGLDISQGEGIIERTLELILEVSSDEGSGAGFTRMLLSDIITGNSPSSNSTLFRGSNQSLNAQSEYSGTGMFFGSATQPLSIAQSFTGMPELFRSINQGLLIDQDRNSTALFGRTEAQGIGASNQFSRFNSVSRILNTGISTTQTFQVFDGVIVLLDQVIGVNGQQTDVFETSRDQETSIGASTGISTSQMVFRSFTQPLVASAGPPFLDIGFIDDLANNVSCRIFGQESRFCETNNDQNDQDTDDGGSDNGGSSGRESIGGIGTGDNSNNESKDSESSGKQGDEKGSEDIVNGSDQIKKVEASLKPSEKVDNIEKLEKSFENLDKGQKVVVETSEDAEGSSGSSDGSPEQGDMIEVQEVSFEVEENEDKTEIDIKTVETPEKLNLTARKDEIYEATNVSTRIDTANASLVYEVEKEFLSRNNASKNDIVVSRWKNGSKVQNLSTEIVNESSDQLVVEAYSPRGFSVFTVGLEKGDSEGPVEGSGKILVVPDIPLVSSLKLLLILSSLYLLRRPLIVYSSTMDIQAKYLVETTRYRLLKYYRRFIWKKKSDVGVEELELTEDVSSLENQKEALKFRKNRLEKEVERKKANREKYRRSLSLLSEKIEKWEKKL